MDMTYKPSSAARLTVNDPSHLLFDNTELVDLSIGSVNSNLNIGEPTREEILKGVSDQSINSVLRTLITGAFIPVGGVYITTVSADPGGSNFIEYLTLSGTSTSEYVTVHNIDIAVDSDTDAASLTSTIVTGLSDSGYFLNVEAEDTDVIAITYNDRFVHEVSDETSNGITFTASINQESATTALCYGTWSLIYTDSTTITDTPLYYYQRTA